MTDLIRFIYVYCTDFIINASNLLGLTYEDFNALIFCVLWPVITLGLFLKQYDFHRFDKNIWRTATLHYTFRETFTRAI